VKRLCVDAAKWSQDDPKRSFDAQSFDHLVGAQQNGRRQFNANCLGGLEIDHHLEFRWLFDRQIDGFSSLENLCDKGGALAIHRYGIRTVGHQAPGLRIAPEYEHARQAMLVRQVDDVPALPSKKRTGQDEQHIRVGAGKGPKYRVEIVRRVCQFERADL
jgi:hypothetical protein